ncbi:MAG: NAD-dependent epimerase/dehydratase family protein [Alphaproteobacteria bacterium]|nr:MAG: NAD-dependent epimerase/dehydratase family protein [Alphaproteobacteria bacterium]
MTTFAVTGAAGYLGRLLVARLAAAPGDRVIGIDIAAAPDLPGVIWHRCDIRDPAIAEILAAEDVAVVVHLAFLTDPEGDPEQARAVNIVGTQNLFTAAAGAGVRRIVLASSAAAYGSHADNPVPMSEDAPLRPNADFPYSWHKAVQERLLARLAADHPGIETVILRPCAILGPHIANPTGAALRQPLLVTFSGPPLPVQFLSEADAVEAFRLAAAGTATGVFNVAPAGMLDYPEIARCLGKPLLSLPFPLLAGLAEAAKRLGLSPVGRRTLGFVRHPIIVDSSRFTRRFGFTPRRDSRGALMDFAGKAPGTDIKRRPDMDVPPVMEEPQPTLDHLSLYRLPWNYADNGISWLEPSTKCNLRCEGCYRDLEHPVHKSLAEMRDELMVFKRLRKSDCMSIAGGDPLVYPHIVELVRMVKEMGWKPIINTNGVALTEPLLRDLKRAGAFGFTFHIDTSQNRPRAKGWSETELNKVRLHYAEMLARVGGLACSFNATISEKTLAEVPALVDWARAHADIVHTMVFILFRSPRLEGAFDFYAHGRKLNFGGTYKETTWGGKRSVFASEIVETIRSVEPAYRPAAYLNGTVNPASFKWLLANRIVLDGETVGYVSPRFLELVQTGSHLFRGRYLSYAGPRALRRGKLAAFLSGLVDRDMRRLYGRLLRAMLARPSRLLRPAHMQSLMIIQPVNFEPDGRQDMCDGCPDMTVHEGRLVWSCRLEELLKHGCFVESVPQERAARDPVDAE